MSYSGQGLSSIRTPTVTPTRARPGTKTTPQRTSSWGQKLTPNQKVEASFPFLREKDKFNTPLGSESCGGNTRELHKILEFSRASTVSTSVNESDVRGQLPRPLNQRALLETEEPQVMPARSRAAATDPEAMMSSAKSGYDYSTFLKGKQYVPAAKKSSPVDSTFEHTSRAGLHILGCETTWRALSAGEQRQLDIQSLQELEQQTHKMVRLRADAPVFNSRRAARVRIPAVNRDEGDLLNLSASEYDDSFHRISDQEKMEFILPSLMAGFKSSNERVRGEQTKTDPLELLVQGVENENRMRSKDRKYLVTTIMDKTERMVGSQISHHHEPGTTAPRNLKQGQRWEEIRDHKHQGPTPSMKQPTIPLSDASMDPPSTLLTDESTRSAPGSSFHTEVVLRLSQVAKEAGRHQVMLQNVYDLQLALFEEWKKQVDMSKNISNRIGELDKSIAVLSAAFQVMDTHGREVSPEQKATTEALNLVRKDMKKIIALFLNNGETGFHSPPNSSSINDNEECREASKLEGLGDTLDKRPHKEEFEADSGAERARTAEEVILGDTSRSSCPSIVFQDDIEVVASEVRQATKIEKSEREELRVKVKQLEAVIASLRVDLTEFKRPPSITRYSCVAM